MRIISPFKDYYDCLQSPTEPIYVRKTSQEDIILPFKRVAFEVGRPEWMRVYLVGFCGEIFPVMTYWGQKNIYYQKWSEFLFNMDDVREHFPKCQSLDYRFEFNIHRLGFNIPVDFTKHLQQYFSYDCPVWIMKQQNGQYYDDKAILVRNPRLNVYNFVNHFGLEQTFQRIEMYLSGLANPNKAIPKLSDEDMITAKGFDKYSFRKDKSDGRK